MAYAGIRGKTLVITSPGKPESIRETFDDVFKSIPEICIQLLGGPDIETIESVVNAFRPPAEKKSSPTAVPGAEAAGRQ